MRSNGPCLSMKENASGIGPVQAVSEWYKRDDGEDSLLASGQSLFSLPASFQRSTSRAPSPVFFLSPLKVRSIMFLLCKGVEREGRKRFVIEARSLNCR